MGEIYFLSGILLLVLLSVVSAVDQQSLPTWQDRYVNDYAGVLDVSQITGIRSAFVSVEQETTAELTFISVSECAPYAPGDLATTLFNQWKVGKADKDNGLLILYCLGENKIFAATGYGLEGILPDSKVGRLLDEYYVSWRDIGNVSEGIVQFSYAVSNVVMENKEEVMSGQAGAKTNYVYVFVIFGIIVLFVIYLISIKRNMKKKKKEKYGWIRVVLGVLLFIIGAQILPLVIGWILLVIGFILLNVGRGAGGAYAGSGFGGSSGGGFGGGGFGGGFSGGGGAGR